ncbi:putative Rho GTPase activation protein [Helianthus annuus]|nr:putative Rho GTPase activation protein [Helianthus annuus]KAJ0651127.1 putative Rho GTPase activation protein [Helianthus annuus]
MTETVAIASGGGCGGVCSGGGATGRAKDSSQLSLLELILAVFRKSMAACVDDRYEETKVKSKFNQMEIGWPTEVKHLTHVTFDRFQGFLGLPVEFEVEVPERVPSASVSVFGVSAESMQCSYDSRGNSVPTILLLMQKRLYAQEGLKAEGIFRINPENSHEEHVRAQLNRGMVPEDIEVHCLAGLIKAWFRELPSGVLDGLSPDEVLQCNTEEERVELVKKLKPTETALLNWAIDLMSDVAEHEELNKMNARNIAMVFAPNMTQMSDPLTALMHAVQVMNLLKTLITKTLREREETTPTWGPQTNNEFTNREEMQTSSELRRPVVSEDEDRYGRADDSDNEVESLSEIEDNFLKQIKENKNAKNRFKKELNDLVMQHSSPTNGFDSKEGS